MRVAKTALLDLLMDVSVSGPLFPGVDTIEPLGDDRYQWRLTARKTLNSTFRGEYIAKYTRSGDEVHWETTEGNVKIKGVWRASGPDGAVRLTVNVTNGLDAPVPRIMKKPAALFAEMEAKNGLDKQLERLEAHLR